MKLFHYLLVLSLFTCYTGCKKSGKNNSNTGDKKNGLVESRDKKNRLLSSVNYKDGKRDGIARSYYPNGAVNTEIPYKMGVMEGTARRYYTTGKIYQTAEYKNDMLHGWKKLYTISGKPIMELFYHNNQVGLGGREFDQKGNVKADPEIIIEKENNIARNGTVRVNLSLNEKVSSATFYLGRPDGQLVDPLKLRLIEESGNTTAFLEFAVAPGEYITKKLELIALYKRKSGYEGYVTASYNLAAAY